MALEHRCVFVSSTARQPRFHSSSRSSYYNISIGSSFFFSVHWNYTFQYFLSSRLCVCLWNCMCNSPMPFAIQFHHLNRFSVRCLRIYHFHSTDLSISKWDFSFYFALSSFAPSIFIRSIFLLIHWHLLLLLLKCRQHIVCVFNCLMCFGVDIFCASSLE